MNSAMRRGRPWGPDDLIGGPVDEVFAAVRRAVPGLTVERLKVTHAADDDNVYFLGDERGLDRVQVGTAPGGEPPFLIEADDRVEVSDVAEAAGAICTRLG
jgi:hypothetical protein